MSRGFAIALGIVVGALAAVLGSRARDLDPDADARQKELERRVRALELVGSKGSPKPVVPPEVQAKLHRELHAARIARHEKEPLDPAWSASTTKLITAGLGTEAAEGQFRVARVDCRTTSCVVAIEWPTRNAALTSPSRLTRSLADLPCTREVLFDEPPNPSANVAATMVLECDRAATGADP